MSMQPAKKAVKRLINSKRERERDLRQFWLKTYEHATSKKGSRTSDQFRERETYVNSG